MNEFFKIISHISPSVMFVIWVSFSFLHFDDLCDLFFHFFVFNASLLFLKSISEKLKGCFFFDFWIISKRNQSELIKFSVFKFSVYVIFYLYLKLLVFHRSFNFKFFKTLHSLSFFIFFLNFSSIFVLWSKRIALFCISYLISCFY